MAIHTELQIHKAAYDLLGLMIDLVKNMPRDVKPVVGFPMRDECLHVATLIQRANTARMLDFCSRLRFCGTGSEPGIYLAEDAIAPGIRLMRALKHVWLGVSVEDQATAEERIPLLLQTPAAVRFLSCEPLLGPISFRWAKWQPISPTEPNGHLDGLRGIDWVIAGGESGPKARPSHPDWFRSLRDQCAAAGVPFFFKQWGEWVEVPPVGVEREGFPYFNTALGNAGKPPAFFIDPDGNVHCFASQSQPSETVVVRVGKKSAGRLLDGRTHDEYPA